MSDGLRFVYSLVRFVPDPARGEFVNVGAVAGSEESSEWAIRQIENPKRARALGSAELLDAVWSFIGRVGGVLDKHQESLDQIFNAAITPTEDWLWRLHKDHRNIVQISPPTPMAAKNVEEALEIVFDLLIVDPDRRRYSFRKKNEVLAALRQAYRNESIHKGETLCERVMLATNNHRERFDFAVANGSALQLAHSWSFQVPDQDSLSESVKSWGWTVQDIQASGGSITVDNGQMFEVDKSVDIAVAYIPPTEGKDSPALGEALNVFDSLGIEPVPVEQVGRVAVRARGLLTKVDHRISVRSDVDR